MTTSSERRDKRRRIVEEQEVKPRGVVEEEEEFVFESLRFSLEDKKAIKRRQRDEALFDGGQIHDIHHEPPMAQLAEMGVRRRDGLVDYGVGLTVVGHAAMHAVRYQLYDDVDDQGAVHGLVAQMSAEEKKRYEKLMNDEQVLAKVKEEIKTRSRKVKVGGW